MLIIVGDEKRHSGFPWVTVLLILLNVAAFVVQIVFGDAVTYGYCLVSVEILSGEDLVGPKLTFVREPSSDAVFDLPRTVSVPHQPGPKPIQLTLLTSMFLHGDLFHLIGNMLFLLVAGRNVERAMGPFLFLVFYLVCGVAASLVHVYVAPRSTIPCIGASGAISAVLGAYLFLFPFILMKVWFGLGVVRLPAVLVLGVWVLFQVVGSLDAFKGREVTGGVAYWVHIGGFVAGFAFVLATLIVLKVLYALSPPRRRAEEARDRHRTY